MLQARGRKYLPHRGLTRPRAKSVPSSDFLPRAALTRLGPVRRLRQGAAGCLTLPGRGPGLRPAVSLHLTAQSHTESRFSRWFPPRAQSSHVGPPSPGARSAAVESPSRAGRRRRRAPRCSVPVVTSPAEQPLPVSSPRCADRSPSWLR